MELRNEKSIAMLVCILGVSSVVYGMAEDNDLFFLAGLVFVVGGYLIIRRKLKSNAKRRIR